MLLFQVPPEILAKIFDLVPLEFLGPLVQLHPHFSLAARFVATVTIIDPANTVTRRHLASFTHLKELCISPSGTGFSALAKFLVSCSSTISKISITGHTVRRQNVDFAITADTPAFDFAALFTNLSTLELPLVYTPPSLLKVLPPHLTRLTANRCFDIQPSALRLLPPSLVYLELPFVTPTLSEPYSLPKGLTWLCARVVSTDPVSSMPFEGTFRLEHALEELAYLDLPFVLSPTDVKLWTQMPSLKILHARGPPGVFPADLALFNSFGDANEVLPTPQIQMPSLTEMTLTVNIAAANPFYLPRFCANLLTLDLPDFDSPLGPLLAKLPKLTYFRCSSSQGPDIASTTFPPLLKTLMIEDLDGIGDDPPYGVPEYPRHLPEALEVLGIHLLPPLPAMPLPDTLTSLYVRDVQDTSRYAHLPPKLEALHVIAGPISWAPLLASLRLPSTLNSLTFEMPYHGVKGHLRLTKEMLSALPALTKLRVFPHEISGDLFASLPRTLTNLEFHVAGGAGYETTDQDLQHLPPNLTRLEIYFSFQEAPSQLSPRAFRFMPHHITSLSFFCPQLTELSDLEHVPPQLRWLDTLIAPFPPGHGQLLQVPPGARLAVRECQRRNAPLVKPEPAPY